jgi:AraC-like DNA-binding protein
VVYAPRVVNLDQGGLGRARTRVLPPPPDLAALVESSFILRDDVGPRPTDAWRVVPDPSAHVVIVLPSPSHGGGPRVAVVGARSTFCDIDVSTRRLTLGVRLRPGALAALARERASVFTDRSFPVEEVLGWSWREVVDRACERDPELALRAVHDLLRDAARGRRPSPVVAAVSRASSVAEAARTLGMPPRTLHDRTQEAIGLSPKRLLRVLRLHRALELYRPALGWADAAVGAGFADQPHLVRELHELLGETPTEWRARSMLASAKPDRPLPIRSRRAPKRGATLGA